MMGDDELKGILRHAGPPRHQELVAGDGATVEAVSSHIETHLGPIAMVWHEIVSTTIHVDVHQVAPGDGRPFHALVTSGMSDRPMKVPAGAEAFRWAELLLLLPPNWSLTSEAFHDERNYWPIRLLKVLARLPHEYDSWLGVGHSVGNGEPPRPYASGTDLCAAVLTAPVGVPEEFDRLVLSDGRSIRFWLVLPLHADELAFKMRRGMDALLERFETEHLSPIVHPHRKSVVKGARSLLRWRRLTRG